MALPTQEQVLEVLAGVEDPEIKKPITELGMVRDVVIGPDGRVVVGVFLTVSGCPLKETITREVTAAVTSLDGVTSVLVELDVMSSARACANSCAAARASVRCRSPTRDR